MKGSTLVAVMFVVAGCHRPAMSQTGAERGTPPGPLQGTSWKLASLTGAEVLGDVSSTVTFDDAGTLAGTDGCNRYRGRWVQSGAALTLTPGASTRKACPGPIMRQAEAFTRALAATRGHAMNGARLVLTGSGGEHLATLVPLPVAALQGTQWGATGVNNGKQAVTSLVAGSEITALFGADGTLTGTAGCNRYMTTYRVTGDTIAIAPAAAGRKMCPEPAMQQERNYLRALARATTYRLGEDQLELRDAQGALQAGFRVGH